MVCASQELGQGLGEGGCLSPLQASDDDPCTWEKPRKGHSFLLPFSFVNVIYTERERMRKLK